MAAAAMVTALILAGGRGRRMNGEDKGLVPFRGRPLIEHVLAAIRPQVSHVLINANRNRHRYTVYGHPVIGDALSDYQGPLAGFAVGLAQTVTDDLVTLPCDGPFVATDAVQRLLAARQQAAAEIAVAHDGQRMQPVYALLHRGLLPSLTAFLDSGERKIDRWYAQQHTVTADFSGCTQCFININTRLEHQRLESVEMTT